MVVPPAADKSGHRVRRPRIVNNPMTVQCKGTGVWRRPRPCIHGWVLRSNGNRVASGGVRDAACWCGTSLRCQG
jgi:hypothetical protein